MAGRPRTPSNVLELRGAFKQNPSRGRARESEPEGQAVDLRDEPVPWHFDELERLVWEELVEEAHAGVMTRGDLKMFVVFVKLLTEATYYPLNPKVIAQLKGYAAMFGMTPADRSRVQVLAGGKAPQKTGEDEFAA